MGDLTAHFSVNEFECLCCGKVDNLDPELVRRLETARAIAGIPFIINSGVRCQWHNTFVGGAAGSQHLVGKAAHIGIAGSEQRFIVLDAIKGSGFKRIGIASTFIHVDVRPDATPAIWLY